ncbi:hypothetical protein JOM56_013172 [Amanita muscaria]
MRRFQIWKVHRAGRLPVSQWTRALYSCKGRLHNRLLVMLEKDTLGDQLDRAGQSTVSIIDLATQLLAGSARPAPYQGGQANGVSDCTGAVLKLGTSFNSQIVNAGCRKEEDHIGTICCEDLSCTGTAVRKLRTCRVRQRKHSGESWTARGQFGLERAAVSGQSRQHEEMAVSHSRVVYVGNRLYACTQRVPGGSHMVKGSYPSSFELVEVEQTVWGRCLFKVVNRVRAILVIYCVLVCQDMYSMVEYNDTITTTSRRETLILSQGKQSGYQASTCVCSVENDAEPETVLLRLMAWEPFSSDGERVEKRDSRLHEGSLNRDCLILNKARPSFPGNGTVLGERYKTTRGWSNGIEVVKGAVGVPTALRWRLEDTMEAS